MQRVRSCTHDVCTVDNREGLNQERQNIEEKPRLLVQTEPDVNKGNQPLQKQGNRTLQKLLRAPRYFEPQACNRRGGNSIKHKISKNKGRWKICYICGERGHKGKVCKQVKGCFICNKKGHLATDCRNKNVGTDCASQLCLACGSSGHDMFSCIDEYDLEDLKAVECYVCRKVGHLYCVNNKTEGQTKASCYNCGETGHYGSDCLRLKDVCDCGENGHSQQTCIEVTMGKVDVEIAEPGAQPAKRRKSRRGGKRKKNKLTPTTTHSGWRPPIVPPYYGRPGSHVWLSYQATIARDPLNPGAVNLPSYQPINHHTST